jgi:membrane associated rhomboid family serine protease
MYAMHDRLARRAVVALLVATVAGLAEPSRAWAYLDPATGSAALQAIVGGLLGGLFVVKRYWRSLWTRLRRRDDTPAPDRGAR